MNRMGGVVIIGLVATLGSVAAYAGIRLPTDAATVVSAKPTHEPRALAALGERIFNDPSLSEPAGTSCASCHEPARAFAGNHGSTLGVALGSRPDHYAKRNTPSVLYLGLIRRFHFRWEEDAPLPDAAGGFFWDGRTDSLADLTRQPMLNADEMGNHDLAHIAVKIRDSAFAAELRAVAGPLDDPQSAMHALSEAMEAFLLSDAMMPFTSKYDDVLRGKDHFTTAEARGLALFKDPAKGNCVSCHKMNDSVPIPSRSPFSDYDFDIVGVPRNTRLPATRDPQYFDLGLCEHDDALVQTHDERFCGAFRTPSLRNVATRTAFMHNGAFTNLRDVVAFYATRATNPKRWYGAAPFDDLPAKYRGNVNEIVAPYDRSVGGAPALDEGEIDSLVAFLQTLTDAAYR